MNGTEIAVLLTGLGTLVAAILGGLRELRKDKTSAAEIETARAMASQTTLIATLQAELERAREEITAARAEWRLERDELRAEVAVLRARVRELEAAT